MGSFCIVRKATARAAFESSGDKVETRIGGRYSDRAQLRPLLALGERWSEEIRYFLIDHLRPMLTREELDFFHKNFAALAVAIEKAIEAAMLDQKRASSSANTAN